MLNPTIRSASYSRGGRLALLAATTCIGGPAVAQTYVPFPMPPQVVASGADGANGQNQSSGGTNGTPGNPGGGVARELNFVASGGGNAATVSAVSNGGAGGAGGNGIGSGGVDGGRGAGGGAGGSVAVRLNPGSGLGSSSSSAGLLLSAQGGAGGAGGNIANRGEAGDAGMGGGGGGAQLVTGTQTSITTSTAGVPAVLLTAGGGAGGTPRQSIQNTGHVAGRAGGSGGAGGSVTAVLQGVIRSQGTGVLGISAGGVGANGASGSSTLGSARGGAGGAGGAGGTVSLVDDGAIDAVGASAPATGAIVVIDDTPVRLSVVGAGMIADSLGGSGGRGGPGNGGFGNGQGGAGGAAGQGGPATVSQYGGQITTAGYAEAGLLGQSIGGGGGNGANAGAVFSKSGGSGGAGGAGGAVNALNDDGFTSTSGNASDAVVAQSIGGGGGYGADVRLTAHIAAVVIGGDGADGGNGGGARTANGSQSSDGSSVISTLGAGSNGLLTQSIGGGGGIGGNASVVAPGVVSVAVGGSAGDGGSGSYAAATNLGVIQTSGSHANGILAQSIGGGGGLGGWGSSLTVGVQFTAATSVGGQGGKGGDGGEADVISVGQITTASDNADGVLAESVGGGGGDAGGALSRVFQIYNDPRIPSIVSSVAVGGANGKGGVGGFVMVSNSGAVLTTGNQSDGLYALSVGGGGGDGGDATALTQSFQSPSISATVAVGGAGGSGGNGGAILIGNTGAVFTLGEQSSGIVAQSVGGGGGEGGAADADTGSVKDQGNKVTAQVTLALGGSGGSSGTGGSITANNAGGVLTRGDGAFGLLAQSVGGGGGIGGVGKALGSGGTINLNVGVGGSGGGGGAGGAIVVRNSGSILTAGGAAAAVVAQSIGGGGGEGGEAATGGGTSPLTTTASFVTGGLGIGAPITDQGNGVFALAPTAVQALKSLYELGTVLQAYNTSGASGAKPPAAGSAKTSITVDVGIGIAGKAGDGGAGGSVTISNTGALQTLGPDASGILAQSVGGGGGEGGAANPSAGGLVSTPSSVDVSLGIGGGGGSSGGGGAVSVVNNQDIQTGGDLSFGIHAESVGGGGGDGGATIAQNAIFSKLTIGIGGEGGASGNGGGVAVNLGAGAALVTTGRDASAILAQSIGGGGGLAFVMGTSDPGQGGIGRSGTGLSNGSIIPGSSIVTTTFDGAGGASGQGGAVNITLDPGAANRLQGSISTFGTDAYGVMAQSVGGGGGLVIGATNTTATLSKLFAGRGSGNGGAVGITLDNGFSMGTFGAGAVGLFAQSVGGGGGVIGGLDQIDLTQALQNTPAGQSGQGGNVSISLNNGANLTTNGYRADGIFAQSVGGGGGVLDLPNGAGYAFSGANPYTGCSGAGCTGAVTVTLGFNSLVRALGEQAYGIVVESRGNGTNNTTINLQGGYVESWGQSAGGVFINGAGLNTINNAGTIDNGTLIGAVTPSGIAITGNYAAVINNSGVINGSIVLPAGASTFNNASGGVFNPGATIMLGAGGSLVNQGQLVIGSLGNPADTTLTGSLTQLTNGEIIVDTAPATGQSSHLQVLGAVSLSGQIVLAPEARSSLTPGLTRDDIVTANGGLSDSALSIAAGTPVISYSLSQPDVDDLDLDTTVEFAPKKAFAAAGLLTSNRLSIGGAIDRIEQENPPNFYPIALKLASLPNISDLAAAYDSLSGSSVADAQQVSFAAQHTFTDLVMRQTHDTGGPTGALMGAAASSALGEHGPQLWISGFGGADLLSSTGEGSSLHTQSAGTAVGIENWFSDDLMLGASIAGSTSNFSVAGQTQDGDDRAVIGGVYGVAGRGGFYVSGAVSYGRFSVSETRGGVAQSLGLSSSPGASFSESLFGDRLELGWRYALKTVAVTPFASIESDILWQDGFAESSPAGSSVAASAVSLDYGAHTETSAPFIVGGRANWNLSLSAGHTLIAEAQVDWVHEFQTRGELSAAFAAAPDISFEVSGVSASRDAAQIALGGVMPLGRRVVLFGSFNGQFSGIETSYGGSGGLRVTW